jgi:hypothetical protein
MITQTLCTSFKLECFLAVHACDTDVFKIALYTSAANLDATTTVYTTTEEVVAAGYTAGGQVLSGVSVTSSGTQALIDWSVDPSWTAALTARGALIYNTSKADKAVAVIDFGADKTSTVTFPVTLPPATASNALVRFE